MNRAHPSKVIERDGFTAFELGLSHGASVLFALSDGNITTPAEITHG